MRIPSDRKTGIAITKIDAARRQLDTAIDLWFREGDPVSIHTLASAARRIVLDLCGHRGIHLGLFDPSFLPKGKEQEYKNMLRKAETFFKHAKDDPHNSIRFNPKFTEVYLLDAADSFFRLTGSNTLLMTAFWLRVFLFNPKILTRDLVPMVPEADRIKLKKLSRKEFFVAFQSLLPILIKSGHLKPL